MLTWKSLCCLNMCPNFCPSNCVPQNVFFKINLSLLSKFVCHLNCIQIEFNWQRALMSLSFARHSWMTLSMSSLWLPNDQKSKWFVQISVFWSWQMSLRIIEKLWAGHDVPEWHFWYFLNFKMITIDLLTDNLSWIYILMYIIIIFKLSKLKKVFKILK